MAFVFAGVSEQQLLSVAVAQVGVFVVSVDAYAAVGIPLFAPEVACEVPIAVVSSHVYFLVLSEAVSDLRGRQIP